jgi:hypothetical protein
LRRIGLGRHGRLEDNAGDPLDGLVNLFDIGIVLAVSFLIAGLTFSAVRSAGVKHHARESLRARVLAQPPAAQRARGRGHAVGTVYRLADGRLVIVSPR